MQRPGRPLDRRLVLAVALDVLAVLIFVVVGRRNHDEGNALRATVETAVPFLTGLLAGWCAVRAWRRPLGVLTGVAVWPVTVLVGMIVRRWVFDRGTATSFVIVATLFLGACLVGWRAVAGVLDRRRSIARAA
jgi:uncharacterized membrane protein (GlpM family)